MHLALAQALQDRLHAGDELSLGSTILSARHLLTIKSGLIVHLYNIEEATMSAVIDLLGDAVGSASPSSWAPDALREWLREHAVARVDGAEENRLKTVHAMSLQLLTHAPLGPQRLKKPTGTWSDKKISTFARRMGVEFTLERDMWVRIAADPKYGDKTPLEFLAERRNALAHGRRSFEDGAADLTLTTIQELADVTLDYLFQAADAFQRYVNEQKFLAVAS